MVVECESCGRELRYGDTVVIHNDNWFCSYECLHDYVDEYESREWEYEKEYVV